MRLTEHERERLLITLAADGGRAPRPAAGGHRRADRARPAGARAVDSVARSAQVPDLAAVRPGRGRTRVLAGTLHPRRSGTRTSDRAPVRGAIISPAQPAGCPARRPRPTCRRDARPAGAVFRLARRALEAGWPAAGRASAAWSRRGHAPAAAQGQPAGDTLAPARRIGGNARVKRPRPDNPVARSLRRTPGLTTTPSGSDSGESRKERGIQHPADSLALKAAIFAALPRASSPPVAVRAVRLDQPFCRCR